MNIVHLLSQTHLTGAEAHAVILTEAQLEAGHAVTIVSDRIHLATRARFIARPIHAARGWARWREILWLRRRLRTDGIDVVHAHSRAAVRIGWWATRGTSTALVSTVHGRQHFSLGKRLFDLYGERVLAVCGNLKRHLVDDFRMRESRVGVLGNPIEFPTATARVQSESDPVSPELVTAMNSAAPLSPGPRDRWLLVTRWSGPKGHRTVEFLRDVLPTILDRFPGLTLEIRGAAPTAGSEAESTLNALAQSHPQRVRHLGFIDPLEPELPRYGLILGGGRIAIAAVGMGLPCFAFGEAETTGIVTETNLSTAMDSNFGDILPGKADAPLHLEKTRTELVDFLDGRGPDASTRERLAKIVRAHFEAGIVAQAVLDVYRSARLIKAHPRPIPVLMYHKVVDAPLDTPHRIFVTVETFRSHLATFRRRGLTSLAFADLLDFKEGRRPLTEFPRRPVILTFDDGYENNLTKAAPLLKEFGFRGVLYLLARHDLRTNTWDEGAAPQVPLMTAAQRQELMATEAFEIGSHGFNHARLPAMDEESAQHELRDSKRALEQEFGRPIHSFAFTYGDIDTRSARQAREAGYAYALNTDRGAIHIEEDPWSVFRVNVFPEDGPTAIAKKTSWWYRWRYWRKRGR